MSKQYHAIVNALSQFHPFPVQEASRLPLSMPVLWMLQEPINPLNFKKIKAKRNKTDISKAILKGRLSSMYLPRLKKLPTPELGKIAHTSSSATSPTAYPAPSPATHPAPSPATHPVPSPVSHPTPSPATHSSPNSGPWGLRYLPKHSVGTVKYEVLLERYDNAAILTVLILLSDDAEPNPGAQTLYIV